MRTLSILLGILLLAGCQQPLAPEKKELEPHLSGMELWDMAHMLRELTGRHLTIRPDGYEDGKPRYFLDMDPFGLDFEDGECHCTTFFIEDGRPIETPSFRAWRREFDKRKAAISNENESEEDDD